MRDKKKVEPTVGIAAVLAVAAGFLTFAITTNLRDTSPSVGANQLSSQSGLPDTSEPDWGRSFRDEAATRPRYEQTVNGIRFIPGHGDASMSVCNPGEAEHASAEEADISPLGIPVAALPRGATLDPAFSQSIRCAGRIVVVERMFVIPHEPSAPERVASGEVSWFDVEHGGYVWVTRMLLKGPAWDGGDVPSQQWENATVGGLPAAVAAPVLPGFGNASVVVWDADRGVLTALRGNDRTIGELLSVAEALVR